MRIEPNTTSLGGQYYTSYTAVEAATSSYWKLELDDLQRSLIQKILAFGYPQVDYGYSRQVQYAATQVLIWEVVSHSRVDADIKSCTDYGLYRNVYAVLGADLLHSERYFRVGWHGSQLRWFVSEQCKAHHFNAEYVHRLL